MNNSGKKDHIFTGNEFFGDKKYPDAIKSFTKALNLNPNNSIALNNLGVVYETLGKFSKAIKYFKQADDLNPNFPENLFNLGLIYNKTNQTKIALKCFQKASFLKPNFPGNYIGWISTLKTLGKLKEIKSVIDLAVKANPQNPQFFYDLANGLVKYELGFEAIPMYELATKLQPDYSAAWANLGFLKNIVGDKKGAFVCFKKIVELNPNQVIPVSNLAFMYYQEFDYHEAIKNLKKCLKIDPTYIGTYSNLYLAYKSAFRWQEAQKIEKILDNLPREEPLMSIIRSDNPQRNFEMAKITAIDTANKTTQDLFKHSPIKKRKLRLGYMSCDFRNHAVGHLIASAFGFHDRSKFEIYVYSYGLNDNSYWRKKVEKEADKFKDMTFTEDTRFAETIYADKIDILIDLMGYTNNSRVIVPAMRPAPIQVTYLGFPGTTGASFFDYILVDKIIAPSEEEQFFGEKLVYLPGSYQINDCNTKLSAKKFKRTDFNLPERGVIFSSFTQNFKLDPEMFKIWMEILKTIPGSVLWLWFQGKEAEQNLKDIAQSHGVSPERIIFSPILDKDLHLSRLQLTDIALDTQIYNGHTTTSDYLWAGVPVITYKGNHFASRVAASLLTTYGVPELVTKSLAEYKNLVLDLAKNPEKLKQIRNKIRVLKKNNPLFDTKRSVRNMEKAYNTMWDIYQKGQKPRQIIV